MKLNLLLSSGFYFFISMTAATGQAGPAPAISPADSGQSVQAVSYASVTQLNGMLEQLEATSKNTQADLGKLRIEKWKADGSYKKQVFGNVDSIQRNLQGALPEIVAALRAAPEDMPATFKLYRNLDALYDVLGNVAEGAGAFGTKDDLQALSNDLSGFEGTRKQLAERIENLSSAKEAEIVRLRADLKTAQAAVPVAQPGKKTVVDENEPAKKPVVKKKIAAKKPTATGATSPSPAAQAPAQQNPPAQSQPAKPQ